MRKEAERYLRDYILFSYLAESQDTDKAEQLDLTFLFPDWQLASENKENQAAPNFPVLMSGGAYFNIEIHGTFPKKNGDFIVSVTQSKENLPDLFFSINKGSAPEKVIKPGESFTILTRNMKEPKWLYNIVSSSIRPIDNDLNLKLPSEDSPSLPSGDGSTENHLFDDLQNLESEDVEITIHQPSYTSHLWEKFSLGFRHVIPSGLDHILFIIAMCMLVLRTKALISQSLIFTLAHTITLAAVSSRIILVGNTASTIIEIIIALSITFLCWENIIGLKKSISTPGMENDLNPSESHTKQSSHPIHIKKLRVLLIFVFGLIHGMGFAGALGTKLSGSEFFTSSLLMANLGIEIAQVCTIITVCIIFRRFIPNNLHIDAKMFFSFIIAAISLFWLGERVLGLF